MRTGHYVDPDARERYRRAYDAAVAALPAYVTDDVDTPFGSVRVLRCTSRRVGGPAGAPLVLLPGTGAPGASFAELLPGLTEQREVLLVDALGGPGGSRQEVPLRRFADQVRWLDAMLSGLGLDGFHLAGVSMGARVALGLGVAGHHGLRSLALLEPVQAFTRIPARAIVASLGALTSAPAWWRRRFLDTVGGDPAEDGTPEGRLFAEALRGFSVAAPFPPLPTDAELRAVSVPTLVVLGGRSALLDAERARRRAAEHLPRTRVEVWPEASHAVVGIDPPGLIADLLAHAAAAERTVDGRPDDAGLR